MRIETLWVVGFEVCDLNVLEARVVKEGGAHVMSDRT